MSKAKKTRFVAPYKNGKPSILALSSSRKQSGVYLIKSNRTGNILYIGFSATHLYKALYRHFQSWRDRTQQRFTYTAENVTVRIIFTTPHRAHLLEKYLIVKLRPRDNEMKYVAYLTPAQTETAAEIMTEAEEISSNETPF